MLEIKEIVCREGQGKGAVMPMFKEFVQFSKWLESSRSDNVLQPQINEIVTYPSILTTNYPRRDELVFGRICQSKVSAYNYIAAALEYPNHKL